MWKKFPELKTNRFLLRKLKKEDSAALFRLFSDSKTTRFWHSSEFNNESEASIFLDEVLDLETQGKGIRWGITLFDNLNNSEKFIGFCGYYIWHKRHSRAEIHYAIDKDYLKDGADIEVLSAIINYGFNEMNLHSIEAQITSLNLEAEKLFINLGFEIEGKLKENYRVGDKFYDSIILSLLKRKWLNSNK